MFTTPCSSNLTQSHAALIEAMRSHSNALYTERIAPIAFPITQQQLNQWNRVYKVLSQVVQEALGGKTIDPLLLETIPLSQKIAEVFSATTKPYRPGSLRVDFLLDQNGDLRICEINARFPTNGYLLSFFLQQPEVCQHITSNEDLEPLKYNSPLDLFCPAGDLSIIRGREKGLDIHMLPEIVEARGGKVSQIPFHTLTDPAQGAALLRKIDSRVILELHQDELTALPVNVLKELHRLDTINDLRTIFCVHDKRFLNLLGNTDFLRRYVDSADAQFLAQHIAKTIPLSDRKQVMATLSEAKKWVLKPCALGKGEGIKFGADCTLTQWQELLNQHTGSPYVLQEKINAATLSLPALTDNASDQFHLVGTLMGFDQGLLAPGIFRAATVPIVAVSTNGWAISPMLIKSSHSALSEINLPPDRNYRPQA
jgi:hypothetical protein